MLFVLDNYDSFTYNLVQYLGATAAVGRGTGPRFRQFTVLDVAVRAVQLQVC